MTSQESQQTTKPSFIVSGPYGLYRTGFIDIAESDALRKKQGLDLQVISGACNPPVITNSCQSCGPEVDFYPNKLPSPDYGAGSPSNDSECLLYIRAP